MNELHFDVFGTRVAVTATASGWQAFLLGEDGKRRLATEIVVPDFVTEDEVGEYLADLLHELATPDNNKIVRLK